MPAACLWPADKKPWGVVSATRQSSGVARGAAGLCDLVRVYALVLVRAAGAAESPNIYVHI